MKKIPFDKATFTVADALKAHTLHKSIVQHYELREEAVAYEQLTGCPHYHTANIGSTTDMLGKVYAWQEELALLHKGTFYCEYTDRKFVCWWSVR